VESMLARPDKLIGLILLGNNLVNIAAASVATLIALRLMGDVRLAVAPFALTAVILIFSEVAPKAMAALYSERIAFPASYVLYPLGKVLNPVVWLVTQFANAALAAFGVNLAHREGDPMTREELRTVVLEAGSMIPRRHQRMLLSILDLESFTVDDIMVPRGEIVGIDLEEPLADVLSGLENAPHTRLPVYRGNIDNIVGFLHMRRVPRILGNREETTAADLEALLQEPYFVPLGTPLHTQLLNFQRARQRLGLVVDEYGVIQGLVTLEDILEEIVGEFTTDLQVFHHEIHPQEDGSYLIDGTATLREINRQLHWDLPTDGPTTLNGLILEHLETMPEAGTTLRIGSFAIEVTLATGNAVRMARVTRIDDTVPDHPA